MHLLFTHSASEAEPIALGSYCEGLEEYKKGIWQVNAFEKLSTKGFRYKIDYCISSRKSVIETQTVLPFVQHMCQISQAIMKIYIFFYTLKTWHFNRDD